MVDSDIPAPDAPGNTDSLEEHTQTFDEWGRPQYNPDIHGNHKKPWTNRDEQYLIENYEKDGPSNTALALERTLHTVMSRAWQLRKAGKMPKRSTGTKSHSRTLSRSEEIEIEDEKYREEA